MTWPKGWRGLPLLLKVAGRPVILLGEGEAAEAKRRLLERAGAVVVGEDMPAAIAVVAIEDEDEALAAVARLKARGLLVNAVDRPEHCDFTLPAIVDRAPVLVAVMTGGASAGLAAALRQRIEALLPARLGELASDLQAARAAIRDAYPDAGPRRRALGAALAPGGDLDPFGPDPHVARWLAADAEREASTCDLVRIALTSPDPDDLTLRQARALAQADRVYAPAAAPAAILGRARADALRIVCAGVPDVLGPGLSVWLEMT